MCLTITDPAYGHKRWQLQTRYSQAKGSGLVVAG